MNAPTTNARTRKPMKLASVVLSACFLPTTVLAQARFGELRRMTPVLAPDVPVLVGPLSDDSSPDILVLGATPTSYLNDGTGAFPEVVAPALTGSWDGGVQDALFAELDGDGLPDLWLGRTPFFGDGVGGFASGASPLAPRPSTVEVRLGAADDDGDGDLDLLFVERASALQPWIVTQIRNLGSGVFVEQAVSGFPGLSPRSESPILLDIDGDRDLDLVFTDPGQDDFQICPNLGGGVFGRTSRRATVGLTLTSGETADVDRDGDADLVLRSDTELIVFANDGLGRFDPTLSAPVPGGSSIELFDFDGDGDIDVFEHDGPMLDLWRNQASAFQNTPSFLGSRPLVRTATCAWSADVDGDGDIDLLLQERQGGPLRLLLNSNVTARVLAADTQTPLAVEPMNAAVSGDLDGDGDADLLVAHRGRNAQIWRNEIGEGFDLDGVLRVVSPENIVLGDVDADGDLDALSSVFLGQTRLETNDGSGRFSDATGLQLPAGNSATTSVALGDLDNDGDPDALLANSTTALPSSLVLWSNDWGREFHSGSRVRWPLRTLTHRPGRRGSGMAISTRSSVRPTGPTSS